MHIAPHGPSTCTWLCCVAHSTRDHSRHPRLSAPPSPLPHIPPPFRMLLCGNTFFTHASMEGWEQVTGAGVIASWGAGFLLTRSGVGLSLTGCFGFCAPPCLMWGAGSALSLAGFSLMWGAGSALSRAGFSLRGCFGFRALMGCIAGSVGSLVHRVFAPGAEGPRLVPPPTWTGSALSSTLVYIY